MNRIRILRKEKGLTQDELGKIVNVQKSAISKYELGRAVPSPDVLTKLSDFFGVTIDYLLGHVSPNPEKQKRDTLALEKIFADDKDTLRFIKDNQISFDGEIYNLSDEGILLLKNAILLAIQEVKNADKQSTSS